MGEHAGDAARWPAGDLEPVGVCTVCGSGHLESAFGGVADPLRPADPPMWCFSRCVTCACLHLSPRPTRDAIGRAYEQYFTHEPPTLPPEPTSRFGMVRRGARNREWSQSLGYSQYESGSRAGRLLLGAPWVRAAAARTVRSVPAPGPGSRLLDVGCANGEYLLQMRALGWDVEGIETDPVARAHAEEAGIAVREGLLDSSVEGDAFDALTMGHVIEHVHDPRAFLGECLRVLRPGGVIWLATPNVDARGLREFGSSYVQLDPPRHLTLFSRTALKALLGKVGFVGVRDEGAVPQASAWTYARSRAIQRGHGSHPEPLPPLPPGLKAKAALADLLAHFSPRHAEEIVLTARKPPRGD